MLLGAWPVGSKPPTPTQKGGKVRLFLLCGGYIVFLIIGAAAFSAIEAPKIADLAKTVEISKQQFLERSSCVNDRDIVAAHLKNKIENTTSFLSGILGDRRRRNEYEDLDDIPIQEQMIHSSGTFTPNSTFEVFQLSPNSDGTRNKKDPPRKLCNNNKINFRFLVYIMFYVAYLLFGGFCFQIIELPLEEELKEVAKNAKSDFVTKYPEVADDDLEQFLAEIIRANDRGISPLKNASSELNWGFGQALFFSSTVVTTIGYGHVTPLSQTGKIFCMIYAVIGIPLTLVLLTAMVERLLIPTNGLLGFLNAKLGHLYQPFNIRLLHLCIIVSVISILFCALPTALFAWLEPQWSVLDAFYYCFISLTTIGLGDYIPGEGVSVENRSIYKIFITCYLIIGLIAMMLALTVFYDIPQLNLGQLFTENISTETEKLRLSGNSAPCYSGPSGLYIPQGDEDIRRSVVRIRPHGEDSPSPDEHPPSLHRDLRVP